MNNILSGNINAQANIYFDGLCISHSVELADGSRKSVGVIFPSVLTFQTKSAEIMETVSGQVAVKLANNEAWQIFGVGESFNIPANSSFQVKVEGVPYHYICHFE